ncbi:MAG: Omp28-related outer membrane protein [Bacteroidota bacterium]
MQSLSSFRSLLLLIIVCVGTSLLQTGCDIIEAPYLDPEYLAQLPADEKCELDAAKISPFPAGQPITKKVLLEEMTGHKCGNCPVASETAYDLSHSAFADQVVLVVIHAGSLSDFSPSSSKFYTDFTTTAGTEIYTGLNPSGVVPFGMIDRSVKNSNHGSWPTEVGKRLQESPTAGLRIFNCLDEDSLQLGTVIDVKYLQPMNENQRLCVWLIETEVVDWQRDYRAPGGKVDLAEYTHHNVFRASLNGSWGEALSESAIESNQRFTKSYSLKINPDFNLDNLKIVAFVYDFDTQEIGQVEQLSLR